MFNNKSWQQCERRWWFVFNGSLQESSLLSTTWILDWPPFPGREAGQSEGHEERRGKDGQRWTSLTTKGPSAMPSMPPRNMVVIPMSLRIALRLFQESWLVICISVFPPVPISADHLLSIVRTHIQHLDSDGWHLEAEDKNQDILRILGNQWDSECLIAYPEL